MGGAPRLRSDERIAKHITRRGRFRKLDPSKGKALPSVGKILGVGAWALATATFFGRARSSVRKKHVLGPQVGDRPHAE